MQTKIQKWGNSLALRIPKSFALNINIQQNSHVDLSLVEGKIVLTPVYEHDESLEELVSKITEKNKHGEFSMGKPVGLEIW